MTNEQILKEAIEKAEKNGFILKKPMMIFSQYLGKENSPFYINYNFIFSHDFAKAFFTCGKCDGKGSIQVYMSRAVLEYLSSMGGSTNYDPHEYKECKKCKRKYERGWQYHLQQMVLEPEPLKYLEKFL